MKSALVAGSTGLTGSALVKLLSDNSEYHQVFLVVRQTSNFTNKKISEYLVDFDKLSDNLSTIPKVDEVFCCLGTTMKKAGNKEAFRKVDYQYPLELAKWASNKGIQRFLCISALGADESSGIFYNRVKGDMERDISKLNIPSITFFRPSLLIGNRKESRPMERLGIILFNTFSFLFIGPLKKYKGIKVEKVAEAMIAVAARDGKGVKVIESGEMNN
jgi:uncharacterized protein YbjT (DUF2867 family)